MISVRISIVAALLLLATNAFAITANDATAILATPNFGSAYVILTSDQDDSVTTLTSPCCDAVEVHTTSMKDNRMQMRKLDRLPLPAKVPVAITGEAGTGDSMHLMLIGVHKEMKTGATFPITFHFAKQKPYTTQFTVVERSMKTSH